MSDPKATLATIAGVKFTPLLGGQKQFTVGNFGNLSSLSLSTAQSVTVAGVVTYVSKLQPDDKDVHFNISPEGDASSYLICEIQNATAEHKIALDNAKGNADLVEATGYFRVAFEHINAVTGVNQYPHILELHSISNLKINGKDLANIIVDCPSGDNWQNNLSTYKMELQSDGSVQFTKLGGSPRILKENLVKVVYQDPKLTVENISGFGIGHNYVYMQGQFVKTGQFSDGDPYEFVLQDPNDSSISIRCFALPLAPGYANAKTFDASPPNGTVTAVALRSLDIQQLFKSNRETILYVYRIDQN